MACQGSMCADCEREQAQKAYYGTPDVDFEEDDDD
jgi:hypothetical protein